MRGILTMDILVYINLSWRKKRTDTIRILHGPKDNLDMIYIHFTEIIRHLSSVNCDEQMLFEKQFKINISSGVH